MIRTREKDYLGGTVDFIKYLINNYSFCADYLVEEFSNFNVLIEYLLNCPSYETKKLVVGIIYCAMIKCVTLYENKMRQEENQQNQILNQEKKSINNKDKKKKDKNKKKEKDENKEKEMKNDDMNNKDNQEEEKGLSDEEIARRLQEELNQESSRDQKEYIDNKNNDFEVNLNPLQRKYIPQNVLKLVYNSLFIIKNLGWGNMNESRFFYLIIFRFSLISKKTKKFLLNKALVLELLNLLLLKEIEEENHDKDKIIKSIEKGIYTLSHDILNTHKKKLNGIYDKGGSFHYENYIIMLYFYLLSHEQKKHPKCPYFEGSYNFDNAKFIKALFFKINTRQDAYIFSYLIYNKCLNPKNYKERIDIIIHTIANTLNRLDNNEKINYDVNSNRDNYNKGVYGGVNEYNDNNINLEKDFPRINPKYVLLIFKRFIVNSSKIKKIDEYRINNSLKFISKLMGKNTNFYNFTIMMIDFLIEIFTKYFKIMNPYITNFSKELKDIIQWLKNFPISPELYPIEGISMYKDDNVAYKQNITDEEKLKFNEEQNQKTQNRIDKLTNIIEFKVNENDDSFEGDFDLTDFKFRKGDIIFYNKKKAIVKEHLDELISIKIIDKEMKENKKNIKQNDDEIMSINDIEKVKFWVAKDDKNISIFNLE